MDPDLTLMYDLSRMEGPERTPALLFPDMGHMELELSPWHFKSRYRLSHESFRSLMEEIEPLLDSSHMGRPRVPKVTRVLATLRYFGTETAKQKVQGDVMGLSQPTVSRIVPEVAAAIASLAPKYITWPESDSDVRRIMKGFYDMVPARFPSQTHCRPMPNVIGCIDGTLINILGRGIALRENFRDRHGDISLNVQAVCDPDLRFTNLVNRWPGPTNDSRIFNECELRARFHSGQSRGILLGDKGYGIKPYLMTPFHDPQSQKEKRYNFTHCQVRNSVERAFGLLKMRWMILKGQINLHLPVALNVITACFVLHNLLLGPRDSLGASDQGLPVPYMVSQNQMHDRMEDELANPSPASTVSTDDSVKGRSERDRIVNAYF